MKKLIAFILSLIMALSCAVSVCADEPDIPPEEEIIEEYVYTVALGTYLDISNNEAMCESVIHGYTGVTRIAITQSLQRWNGSTWSSVATWYNVYNSDYIDYINYKSSLASGTYRVKTYATVYMGNNYEYITDYSDYDYC